MIHVGDITKLNGAEIPVVDVVTGGSPCQDLSVAGKRAGLAGERSGLFMEQVRIVKEMREHDRSTGRTGHLTRPRYMLWENVPGAFSSNKGEDFRAVLEEIAKVEESNAVIPGPPKGKWSHAGCIVGDGWSIAWRLHDAQFWGVPQRRKRIALVADFGGQSAPEILFERKGMRRNPEESGEEGEGTTADVKGSVAATISCLNDQGGSQMGVTEDVTGTLRAQEHGHQPVVFEPGAASRVGGHVYEDDVAGTVRANAGDNQQAVCYGISSYESNAMKSANPHSGIYEAETARTLDNNGGSPACNQGGMVVVESAGLDSFNQDVSEEVASTIRCAEGGDSAPKVVAFTQNQRNEVRDLGEKAGALAAESGVHQQTYVLEGNGSRPSHKGDGYAESETMYTLNGTEHHAVAYRKTSHAKSAEDGQGWAETEVNDTLNAFDSGETRTPTVVLENHPQDSRVKISEDGIVQTLSKQMGTGGGNVPMVMEAIGGEAVDCRKLNEGDVSGTLQSKDNGWYSLNYTNPIRTNSIVRRLTPLECERLQGFPDGWTDIGEWTDSKGKMRKCSDSARYKALGNSIAIPFWFYILRRMAAQYERPATLGSLFDGIGGFPLCWERCNGKGTAIWASEIEEFPIAVTKKRFGDS